MDLPFSYKVDGSLQIIQVDNTAVVSKEGGSEGVRERRGDGWMVGARPCFGQFMRKIETLPMILIHNSHPSIPPSLLPPLPLIGRERPC